MKTRICADFPLIPVGGLSRFLFCQRFRMLPMISMQRIQRKHEMTTRNGVQNLQNILKASG